MKNTTDSKTTREPTAEINNVGRKAYTAGFQKMVDLSTAQGAEQIRTCVLLLPGNELTREERLARSAMLVAFENLEGADACETLMDLAGI